MAQMPEKFTPLPGMKDQDPGQLETLEALEDSLSAFLASWGYRKVATPVLEPEGLFIRKSGEELAAQMYSFQAPGGERVALRPEITASVVRLYLRHREGLSHPVRWSYAGPVFRHIPLADGMWRQFTQVGAELIGSSSAPADAEVLAAAFLGLESVGIKGCHLHLGHIGVLLRYLDLLGVTERAKVFLLGSLGDLARGDLETVREKGKTLGLLRTSREPSQLFSLAQRMDEEEAREVLSGLLLGPLPSPLGSRTPEEVLGRFLRKMRGADEPAKLERALAFAAAMGRIKGEPRRALAQVKALCKENSLAVEPLDSLEWLLQLLEWSGLPMSSVTLDMGLARGLSYYSGVVFEIYHPAASAAQPLCGGGRYDELTKALGGLQETPALGFAWNLEILSLVPGARGGMVSNGKGRRLLILPRDEPDFAPALRRREELRRQGNTVFVELDGRNLEECIQWARGNNIVSVIEIGGGMEVEHVSSGRKADVAHSPSQ